MWFQEIKKQQHNYIKKNPEQSQIFCRESKQHPTWKTSAFREQQHSLFLEIDQLKCCAKGVSKRFHVQNLLQLKVLFVAYETTWSMKYNQVIKNLTWILYSIAASSLVHSQGEFYSNRCWDAELQKLQKWPYQNPLEDTPLQKSKKQC